MDQQGSGRTDGTESALGLCAAGEAQDAAGRDNMDGIACRWDGMGGRSNSVEMQHAGSLARNGPQAENHACTA